MQDAKRCLRCLTILGKLTDPSLLADLWPVVLAIARLVAAAGRPGQQSPRNSFQFETELMGLLWEMGRRIVEWRFNRIEPDDAHELPRQLKWEGEYYRRRRKSPLRNLNCLFGPIKLWRFYYQPMEALGRCLFPLEFQLGIVAGVATPALADAVARMSADLTQRQLLEQLRGRGVRWGVRTLRKVTHTMAERMSEHRHEAQVEQLLGWLKKAAGLAGPRRFALSVGRDGVMIPVAKCSKYREAAAATVSVIDRWGRRIGTIYLGQMPEAYQTTLSDELTRLLQDVLARWEGALPRLTYVTDCGSHATDYFEQVLSRMPDPRQAGRFLQWEWIVDYYHACQYITQLGEAIFGPGRAAFAWASKQRKVLKEKPSGCFRVLRSAGALLGIRGLIGSEESYWKAYLYLHTRASKMDYRTYRRLRLPIGSGVTEAACKIVFTQRFKQSGMKWEIEGGKPILLLRVIALSGVWSQVRDAVLGSYKMPAVPTANTSLIDTAEKCLQTAA